MNKNITFFIALSIFGLTYTSEPKTYLAAKEYTLEYNFSAKDTNNFADFNDKTQKLLNLFERLQRNPDNNTNFYDQILSFIQELQEAIVAGINLFSSSSTTTNNAIATVNEAAQTAEEVVSTVEQVQDAEQIAETIQTVQTTQTEPVATVASVETVAPVAQVEPLAQTTEEDAPAATKALANPKIQFAITISCDNPNKEVLFEELKTKMDVLSQAINDQSSSADEITAMLNDIIVSSKGLGSSNKLCVNIIA